MANTAQSQQLKFTADPKLSNTARSPTPRSTYNTVRSFAGNSFVFAGFSLPSMRILNFYKKYMCTIATEPNIFFKHCKRLACQKILTLRNIQ